MSASRFSLIVPVYEQWHLVPRLLDALRSQAPWHEMELLLIDNGSRESLPPADLPDWAQVLTCDTPGSYAARNIGIRAARGHWLIFTDADCIPAPDWLETIAGAVAAPDAETTLHAGAVRVTAPGGGTPNSYQIYDMVKGIPQAHYVRRGYAATANLCVPARTFRDAGLFEIGRFSGGDAEFCRRALARGYRLAYLPEAVVEHPARNSWRALATKTRRIKGGQLAAGSLRRRALYLARTFMPPAIAAARFLAQRHRPLHHRAIAVAVQLRLWLIEMHEALRLALGATPERR